jgi:hypothetical protein
MANVLTGGRRAVPAAFCQPQRTRESDGGTPRPRHQRLRPNPLTSVTSAAPVSITTCTRFLRQCIAGSLLRFPVRPLVLVDPDALPSCLGGAICAALATDDGVFDGAAKQKSGVIGQPS